ncbi:hypothetical protein ACQI5H_23795 [Mycobacterium heidelbergense]|uniref:hypothetical protein n=1 Tax=Mycobacterium heidelbergense TaxID=53376 RepID=UPI003CE77A73
MSYGIEGSTETDNRQRLAAMVVRVSAGLGYFCKVSADQVELSGNGLSGWMLNLENLYRKVAGEPQDQWHALVTDHLSTLLSAIDLATETPLDTDNFEQLRPLIRTRIYPENMQVGFAPVVSRILAPGLVQRVVLDQVNTIVPVTHDHLSRWPVEEPELFDLAEANTRGDGLLEVTDIDNDSGETIIGLHGSSDYASAHIRWLGAYPVAGRWGAAFVVPCEGMIYVHPLNGTDAFVTVGTLAQTAAIAHAQRPNPLSSSVYWWHDEMIHLAAVVEESYESLGLHVSPDFQKVMEDIAEQTDDVP